MDERVVQEPVQMLHTLDKPSRSSGVAANTRNENRPTLRWCQPIPFDGAADDEMAQAARGAKPLNYTRFIRTGYLEERLRIPINMKNNVVRLKRA